MLQIIIQTEHPVTVVIPKGRIDTITSADLDQSLRPLIVRESYLIMDLSQCTFLSSAGIRVFLISAKKLGAGGGGLFLCGLSPEVFQVLEMAGMIGIFRMFQTPEEAISEIERIRLLSIGSHRWKDGELSFEFTPVENKVEAARIWDREGIAGYNELSFSVGIGSPAESPEDHSLIRGIFISNGRCSGFIPADPRYPSDFSIPQDPASAGIFISRGLTLGDQPMGLVRLSEPAHLSLEHLVDAIYPLKQKFKSDEINPMALVVANLDPQNPFILVCALVDSELSDLFMPAEFPELEGLIPTGTNGLRLWGAKFLLGDIPDAHFDGNLSEFLRKILTIENLVEVEAIKQEEQLVNPVTWIFLADGISNAASKRLIIETDDDHVLLPYQNFLARRLYTDSSRVVIKQIHGGYSAQTFQVTSYDHKGRKLRPTVLKIADRAMISRESDRCKRYANPYILNNSAMVLGTEFFGNMGALRYNFVGIGGEQTQLKWLTHYFHHWSTEQLEPLFDKIFLQILHPWYGQPIREIIYPYRDHDPRSTFFPQLCETASEQLLISAEEQFITVKETDQRLPNPYWFLKYEFSRRGETAISYYTSICHGDLNMQNILLDEDMNVYLIDFSETKPRSVISDFARLEAIFMVDNAPLDNLEDMEEYLKFIFAFYNTVKLDESPEFNYTGEHRDQVNKHVALTIKMREYAFKSVENNMDAIPYCIALLEWILPIVCYSSASAEHKRLSMVVSGLLCQNVTRRD